MKCESFIHRFSQPRKFLSIKNFYEPRNFDQMNKFKCFHHKMSVLSYIWINIQVKHFSNLPYYSWFSFQQHKFWKLIEIYGLVEISYAQKFSGLWKPMYKPFTFHLSFDCSTLRKKTLQFLLRPMENVCLIRSLTCASLYKVFLLNSGITGPKRTLFQLQSSNSIF